VCSQFHLASSQRVFFFVMLSLAKLVSPVCSYPVPGTFYMLSIKTGTFLLQKKKGTRYREVGTGSIYFGTIGIFLSLGTSYVSTDDSV